MGALRKIAALTLGQPPALIDRLFVPRTEGGRNARVSADGAMLTVDIGRPLMILALALAVPPGQGWAQDIGSEAPPYCSDLQRVTALAMARERFAAITGKPREGNFQETSLALTGWNNCALYGAATYTCDSPALGSAQEAERTQAEILRQIKVCLSEGWAEASDRSSPNYVVLHNALRPVSITLSTDQTDDRRHVVHLNIFVRRN